MNRCLAHLLRCRLASSTAEFALVLPLFLILLLGTIDAGRLMWEYNRAEKATQVGARMASVTQALSSDLIAADFADGGLAAGELIPHDAMGSVLCTSAGCTCEVQPCPFDSGTVDSDVFTNVLVARMQQIMPTVGPENVQVRYSGSGFGFAAGPVSSPGGGGGGGGASETMEISPLITVSLTDLEFRPVTSLLFVSVNLPAFSTTVTAEDASGRFSN